LGDIAGRSIAISVKKLPAPDLARSELPATGFPLRGDFLGEKARAKKKEKQQPESDYGRIGGGGGQRSEEPVWKKFVVRV